MSPKTNPPQLLDERVYQAHCKAVRYRKSEAILDNLVAAAAWLDANPFMGDPTTISAGNVITVMADSIKVLSGEVGDIAREPAVLSLDEDDPQRWREAEKWQRWVHSLETLALVIGEDLGTFPQVVRQEFVQAGPDGRSKSATERQIRLWKSSRLFMFRWAPWSQLSRKQRSPEDPGDYDHLVSGVDEMLRYLYGLPENWSPGTWKLRGDLEQMIKESVHPSPAAMLEDYASVFDDAD